MKRLMLLKFFTIVILAFSSTYGVASSTSMSEGKESKAILEKEKLHILEASIIKDFLKQNVVESIEKPQIVFIYHSNGELIFEGVKDSEEAKKHVIAAELLTETADWAIYLKQ